MVDTLFKFAEDNLAKGISPATVKQQMLREGYSPALVEGVMESVMQRRAAAVSVSSPLGVSHEKTVFPKIILLVVFIGLIIAGVVYLPALVSPKEALLDISVEQDKLSFYPGEEVGFDLEVSNMGSADRFDITLLYRVLDSRDNSIASKEETVAISTTMSHHRSVTLPTSIRPGTYVMKVFANYEDKIATSSFSFDVLERVVAVTATCVDRVQNQDETGPDCGGVCGGYWYDGACHAEPKSDDGGGTSVIQASCNDNTMNQDEVGVDCGGVCGGYWYDNSCHSQQKQVIPTLGKSFAAIKIEAANLAVTDPEGAKNICVQQITDNQEEKDLCLKNVAHKSMQKIYCDMIQGVDDKDECYYPFFLQGEYTVCDKITDPQSQQACNNMKEIELLRQELENQG
ncbi:MAG: hypothetical protein KKF46_06755 [Nanoarchaeota archaeon]|nr:hypothetical protein [Nanoarchaeota archaeon]MBU1322029.1 hypothetical protein [Nanoarchaeota archaeon]MBU1597221.1 hypothetical protein [Nanoarchaeota archaeon]MBU2440734.1 hypothetical protein [Nanoarchaeota archaeon]